MSIFITLEPGQDLAPRDVIVVKRPGKIFLKNGRVITFREIIQYLPDRIVVRDLYGNILEIDKQEILRIKQ